MQKAEKLFQIGKVDFLTGTVNSGSTLAVGQVAERSGRLIATTVSFANSITGDKCSPNVFRVNARAGQQSAALASWLAKEKPQAKVFYLGPDYEMGRSTVAAFRSNVERIGGTSLGEVFAPLDSKDYTQYFGQLRAARPQVLYTSVAGNDTVRLLTQLQEFGLRDNFTILGASGTVTSQNIGAIGKAAEGFVTGVGLLDRDRQPGEQEIRRGVSGCQQVGSRTSTAPIPMASSMHTRRRSRRRARRRRTRVREALRGLKWSTPQGEKTLRAGDHQAMQTMYVVKVTGGEFKIVGQVAGEDAIGKDECTRF